MGSSEQSSVAPDALRALLTDLLVLGSVQIDRGLRELVTSRDQRGARPEWLRRTHALLLLRLEGGHH
jgi:hypothetical protein